MEEVSKILTEFLSALKEDILEYYRNTYIYLKDVISYKNINLGKKISTENKANTKDTLEKMVKAIITSLNTMGVSMNILSKTQKDFIKIVSNKREYLQDYESYFNLYKELYLDNILFNILIEYLADVDTKKIEILNILDIVPQHFLLNLKEFKKKYLISNKNKEVLKETNIESLVDFSQVTIKNINKKPISAPKISSNIPEEQNDLAKDILNQLRTAKKDIIEKLKVPKKKILKQRVTQSEKSFEEKSLPDSKTYKQKSSIHLKKTEIIINTFLDYYGNFPSIHPDLISKFKINISNLINSKIKNPDFLDLECLFFYVSILKMLNMDLPFSLIEISEIIKNHVNNKIFSSDKNNFPDPINNFYGLSVVSELNLLKDINFIDLSNIEKYVKSELEPFISEKLELNFYSLLCLKLLSKLNTIDDRKEIILNSILNLQLANLENFKPILDIFHKLTSIKLLNNSLDISRLIRPYIAELKRNLRLEETKILHLTTIAKVLLIFDVLDLKEQENVLCNHLINSIINSTHFFELENLNRDFNWRTDKLAYKIELKMLFYALFACSRYYPLNFERL